MSKVIVASSPYILTENFSTENIDKAFLDEKNELFRKGRYFNVRYEKTRILSAPFLVFGVHRNGINDKPVEFPEKITVGGEVLGLRSVVVFKNAHYTCYFCYDGVWYNYNDTFFGNNVIYTGSFQSMVNDSPSPLTGGTLFFYESI